MTNLTETEKKEREERQRKKHFLNLAGEFSVCSELLKREIQAHLTFGNQKAADVIMIDKNKKSWVVEVKTSNTSRFVTGFFQKYYSPEKEPHPDFWVLVHIDSESKNADFYVFTHEEMAQEQMKRNGKDVWEKVIGVDNVDINDLEQYKNKWDTILKMIKL
jgi:hypothetical protein